MREAVVDAKVAVREIQEAVARTERELSLERQRLADAERRGRLAGEIQDAETVSVADRFAAKHRERLGVLERKLANQREELALAQRELDDMQAQLKTAERDRCRRPGTRAPAWICRTSCSSPIWTGRHAKRPRRASSKSSRRK